MTTDLALKLTRRINATPERLFDAWLDPADAHALHLARRGRLDDPRRDRSAPRRPLRPGDAQRDGRQSRTGASIARSTGPTPAVLHLELAARGVPTASSRSRFRAVGDRDRDDARPRPIPVGGVARRSRARLDQHPRRRSPRTAGGAGMTHATVSREDWTRRPARRCSARERAFTRERDALAAARRALPRRRIDEGLPLSSPSAASRRSSICSTAAASSRSITSCSVRTGRRAARRARSGPTTSNGTQIHLAHRDTTLVMVSRAPFAKLDAYRRRMGWDLRWVSSARFRLQSAISP